MGTRPPNLLLALLAGLSLAQSAGAQTLCRLPERVTPAPERPPHRSEISRTVADHHVLAMSWSPEFCRGRGDQPADALQCRRNSFGFVLHGLWPSASRGPHPRYCRPAPPLAPETVRANLCLTPSAALLQNEWAAHGTCGWPSSAAYFNQAAALWNGLSRPPLAGQMTAGALRDAFIARNPGLPRRAIQVRVSSGNRLREVGVCYSLAFRPLPCPTGIGAPDTVVLRITPRS